MFTFIFIDISQPSWPSYIMSYSSGLLQAIQAIQAKSLPKDHSKLAIQPSLATWQHRHHQGLVKRAQRRSFRFHQQLGRRC